MRFIPTRLCRWYVLLTMPRHLFQAFPNTCVYNTNVAHAIALYCIAAFAKASEGRFPWYNIAQLVYRALA